MIGSVVRFITLKIAMIDYKYGKFSSYNEWAEKWGFDLEDIKELIL